MNPTVKALYDAHLASGISYLELAKIALDEYFKDQSVKKSDMLANLEEFSSEVDSLINAIEEEENVIHG